jgi:hydrogenase-4 component F
MSDLIHIAVIPLTLIILSLQILSLNLRVVAPIMIWCQLGLLTWKLWPALCGPAHLCRFTDQFMCDQTGALFALLTTAVVASCLTQSGTYFAADPDHVDPAHEKLFYAATSAFLLAMTFVFLCDNLGMLWVCIEATTLSSAPLVYFDRTNASIEAAWKYLIICSVGIAFALLGTVMIFASSQQVPSGLPSLQITFLVKHAFQFNPVLLNLGFVFCLLGYGTKAGIFPMHNWLPDAHSEAPAPASAMLSGALLNCALFGIWRMSSIVVASGQVHHAMTVVTIMGAITALAGSLFLIRQHSLKRIWAYSSIENVGIMLTTIGLGSAPLFFLQALNHSIAKVALFLVSGNIIQAAKTKRLSGIHGLLDVQPTWAILLILAAFAGTGVPPFGMFTSELQIIAMSATARHWPIALALLLAITISFIAICVHLGRLVCGTARPNFSAFRPVASSIIPTLLILCSLALGVLVPPEFWTSMR